MGFMCKDARQMDRENIDVQKILERMAYIRKHTQVILTLNTMEYARMSGRVRTLQAAIASLLNVKPIIVLNDGILDVVEKVRTRGRSLNRVIELMIERIGEKLVDLAVVHAQDEHIGEQLLNKVRQVFNYKELIFSELSIGVAANLGPGTMGIVACPAREG
jgi:DegV family protein with EDD domain